MREARGGEMETCSLSQPWESFTCFRVPVSARYDNPLPVVVTGVTGLSFYRSEILLLNWDILSMRVANPSAALARHCEPAEGQSSAGLLPLQSLCSGLENSRPVE